MNLKNVVPFNNPPGKITNNMTTPHLQKSIGSSSSRLALLLITLVFACLGIRQSAQAGYIVTLQQVGPDVVATGSGAIDLHGLRFPGSWTVNPAIRSGTVSFPPHRAASIFTGPTSSSVDVYSVFFGPTNFGFCSVSASSGSGDMVGIFSG